MIVPTIRRSGRCPPLSALLPLAPRLASFLPFTSVHYLSTLVVDLRRARQHVDPDPSPRALSFSPSSVGPWTARRHADAGIVFGFGLALRPPRSRETISAQRGRPKQQQQQHAARADSLWQLDRDVSIAPVETPVETVDPVAPSGGDPVRENREPTPEPRRRRGRPRPRQHRFDSTRRHGAATQASRGIVPAHDARLTRRESVFFCFFFSAVILVEAVPGRVESRRRLERRQRRRRRRGWKHSNRFVGNPVPSNFTRDPRRQPSTTRRRRRR